MCAFNNLQLYSVLRHVHILHIIHFTDIHTVYINEYTV